MRNGKEDGQVEGDTGETGGGAQMVRLQTSTNVQHQGSN